MLPKVIGLLARARCGKDTVGDYIISQYSPEAVVKHRLAQPIKDAVCALYGFTPCQIESDKKEQVDTVIGISPRQAMIGITTHVMEEMGRDFFSRRLFGDLDAGLIGGGNQTIIVPDVRYEHDIYEIRRRGGIVIKIVRPNVLPRHAWEDGIDNLDGDFLIINSGKLAELYAQVDIVLSTISKHRYR